MEDVKNRIVTCTHERHEIVIRVGTAYLAQMVPRCRALMDNGQTPSLVVADEYDLAEDVRKALIDEEEDGTTPLHRLLEAALVEAAEQGSTGYAES